MSHRMEVSITGCNIRNTYVYEWKETLSRLLTVLEQFQLIGCRNLHDFICKIDPFPRSERSRLLLCYLTWQMPTKSVKISFVSICLGFNLRLTRLNGSHSLTRKTRANWLMHRGSSCMCFETAVERMRLRVRAPCLKARCTTIDIGLPRPIRML